MGFQDLRHYRAPEGDVEMLSFPVTASQSFVAGEPVVVTAAGTLSACADDPSAVDGIAAHKSSDRRGTDLGVGHPVTVYGTSKSQIFITKNFATDGSGTAATPAITNVGDLAGYELTSGTWSVDIGQNNLILQIVGVQDAAGNDLGNPNILPGTGVWVLYRHI